MDRNRKAAFDILLSVEKGAYSNIASNKIITQSRPDDPRFVRELVHGVLSGEIFLDHVLDQLIPSGIKKVKAREKILLRLGLFQIIKAEKIPDMPLWARLRKWRKNSAAAEMALSTACCADI